MGAVEDIVEWSDSKLSPWRQDALRRLAVAGVLNAQDRAEVLSIVKAVVGFSIDPKPPAPIPLAKAHLAAATGGSPIKIKAIQGVRNVNRLMSSAELKFAADGLTVVYGRNGSGKSGFVRIFRTACRTRTDSRAKLKVLADVYGAKPGPQEAEIVVEKKTGESVVKWKAGDDALDELLQVAVFDSSAAELYVDGGNQIQFLPFGLSLPHKLNTLCLSLKGDLEAEQKMVTDQLALAVVQFEVSRETQAQKFYAGLSGKTTDDDISKAAKFSTKDQARFDELTRLLAATTASAADLNALFTWVENLAKECKLLLAGLDAVELEKLCALKKLSVEARKAAALGASDLFSAEPLPGVGSETWRLLWVAAREYSISEAYPALEFPVLSSGDADASCVLCHQPLSEGASQRLQRFQSFVSGALAVAADEAETKVAEARASLKKPEVLNSKDWSARFDQISKRDAALGKVVSEFKVGIVERYSLACSILDEAADDLSALQALESPEQSLTELAQSLLAEASALVTADEATQRALLLGERNSLADQKVLAASLPTLIKRRNLLQVDVLFKSALAEVQTTGITKKANDLLDLHLTKAVVDQYDLERKALDIQHLKIALARKSDQTKALFQTVSGTALTKLASDILSEGEQRALALAAFLTEVTVTEGSGPVVIDDPVSSLDRDRGLRVAQRVATEAKKRQVILFTHDLVFFNELCREADEQGVTVESIALFADANGAGKIDPAGVVWKGLNVKKRIAKLRADFAPIKKLHGKSPSDYEFHIKNLYGRLRDTFERLVEEYIFCDVVRRGVDRVETQKLRMVHLSDALAVRFHDGMSKANTHSHDNPAADTVAVPPPAEFENDLAAIEGLMNDLKAESAKTEAGRPSMKAK